MAGASEPGTISPPARTSSTTTDGFGGQEIAENLVVVGDDWWLERHEYDGSEWWEFKVLPELAPERMPLPPSLLARDVRDLAEDGAARKAHPLSAY